MTEEATTDTPIQRAAKAIAAVQWGDDVGAWTFDPVAEALPLARAALMAALKVRWVKSTDPIGDGDQDAWLGRIPAGKTESRYDGKFQGLDLRGRLIGRFSTPAEAPKPPSSARCSRLSWESRCERS